MNLKLAFIIIVLFTVIFTVFATVVNAENLNFLCSKKQKLAVTLKNEASIESSKDKILQISNVKIISTKYRDKEWSKMVNKYDLPNMENPFKNEFVIKINKKADINEIYNKIKDMDFVENVEYISNIKSKEN